MLDREMRHAEKAFDRACDAALVARDAEALAAANAAYHSACARYLASMPANPTDAADRLARVIKEGCECDDALLPIRSILEGLRRDMKSRRPIASLAARLRRASEAADILAGASDCAQILRGVVAAFTRPRLA